MRSVCGRLGFSIMVYLCPLHPPLCRFRFVSLASEYLAELVILLVCVCTHVCCFLLCQDLTVCACVCLNISREAVDVPILKATVPSL